MSKILKKAKYQFSRFVEPGCFWPTDYTIEQAFGVLKWMVDTGSMYKGSYYKGTNYDVNALLSKKPDCLHGQYYFSPIVSIDDLRERFHYAILYNPRNKGVVNIWREENSIQYWESKIIIFPHYNYDPLSSLTLTYPESVSEKQFEDGLTYLFSYTGRLKVQLNKSHRRAKQCYGVHIATNYTAPGWRFVLTYGYGGSTWDYMLSEQKKDEPFYDTYIRAKESLSSLTTEDGGA